jgi:hypothetical protein
MNGGDGDIATAAHPATKNRTLLARDSKLLHSTVALPTPNDVLVSSLRDNAARAVGFMSALQEMGSQTARSAPTAVGSFGSAPSLTCAGTDAALDGMLCNVIVVSSSYRALRDAHVQHVAARTLLRWLRHYSNRRRLLTHLRHLLLSAAQSRDRIYAAAARRIQPLWRGAWTRMRLAKALRPDDDDDDVLFKRVDIDAELAQLEAGIVPRGSAVVTMRRQAAGAHDGAGGRLFELPPEPRPPASARDAASAGGRPGLLSDVSSPLMPRPNSMPSSHRPPAKMAHNDERQAPMTPSNLGATHSSNGGVAKAMSASYAPTQAQPDEAWGDVAAQIRKRDMKRAGEKRKQEAKGRYPK